MVDVPGRRHGQLPAAHLIQAPRRTPHLDVNQIDAAQLPVTHGRQRCLLDHASALRDALVEVTSATVTIDVPDAALQAAADLFEPAD